MARIKIKIAYKGTNYNGWQIQPNGMTVQEEIQNALKKITKENIVIHGSGRTDSGVHAHGQIAHFDTQSTIPPKRFYKALNSHLPMDIRVVDSELVEADFHSRFSAIGKYYRYGIYLGEVSDPFLDSYYWHIDYPINLEKMEEALPYFVGTKDFRGFMASGSMVQDTTRTINKIQMTQQENRIHLDFWGNGFLYNMVRIITGTLIEVGRGSLTPEAIEPLIQSKERSKAGKTAPARGLFLEEVFY